MRSALEIKVELERPKSLPKSITCPECRNSTATFTKQVQEEFIHKRREIRFAFPAWVCESVSCGKYIFLQPVGTQVVSRIVGGLVREGFVEEEMDGFLNLSWLPKNV